MCSATQLGLRVVRLYEEVREEALRRSDTGPGKPYWKSPEGSTGARAAAALGSIVPIAMGEGGRGAVFQGTAMVGDVAVTACAGSCCLLAPKNTAVVAAPTAAEAPATAARVSLLMVAAIIGEVFGQNTEKAAESTWSVCSSVVSQHKTAATARDGITREFHMNFCAANQRPPSPQWISAVSSSTILLHVRNYSKITTWYHSICVQEPVRPIMLQLVARAALS
jgi:hypothetical protein